jgi:MinD-like ATPase involved in chromosome partitioning or flagellar assembly
MPAAVVAPPKARGSEAGEPPALSEASRSASDGNSGSFASAAPAHLWSAQQAGAAPIIGVLGAKGGIGSTTTTVNFAAAISELSGDTTLIDANLQQPDAALMLESGFANSLSDILKRYDPASAEITKCCRAAVSGCPNLFLLSPPMSGEAILSFDLSQLSECLAQIRHHSEAWVLDVPRHLDESLISLLDLCDCLVLVTDLSATSLSASRRWISVFKDLKYSNFVVALNRADAKSATGETYAHQLLSSDKVISLPNCFGLMQTALAKATPAYMIAPRSQYAKAVRKLVASIEGAKDKLS